MGFLVPLSQKLIERGLLPDVLIRWGMRRLLRRKLNEEAKDGLEASQARLMALLEHMQKSPIAIHTQDANSQHYELPTEFFQMCLGKNLKYSSCYYKTGKETLDEAEDNMLELTCQRAEIQDGQDILELGCGWGSLSLFMASRFPKSRITAVSNSKTQKAFIDAQAQRRGIHNLKIITCDMNVFNIEQSFDRVVSIEMFEHMRNWETLLDRIAGLLKPAGKLFIHIFTHKHYAYLYDAKDESDFIGRYFFTGGIMPSDSMLLYFQKNLLIEDHWQVDGIHYGKTAEHWLSNLDFNKEKILPILKNVYGEKDCIKWWHYWRIFYMACAELWNYQQGREWLVSHYRFIKK